MKSNPADGHVVGAPPVVTNHCFGCGEANPGGMHLKFTAEEGGRTVTCRVSLPRRFEGPPGHAHGGIIATILDEAMGKVNKLYGVVALTRRMEIDYRRPVPLRTPLVITGRAADLGSDGRKHFRVGEIRNEAGDLLASSTGLFIAIDPHEMFAEHIRATRQETE